MQARKESQSPAPCNRSLESQLALGHLSHCGAPLCTPRSQPPHYSTVTCAQPTLGSQTRPKWCRNLQEKSVAALYRCALSVSRLTFQKCQPNSHTQPAAFLVEPVIFGLVTTASVNSFAAHVQPSSPLPDNSSSMVLL